MLRGSIALALATLLAGCRGEKSEASPESARVEKPAPAPRTLEVMMSGCWESTAAPPMCELSKETALHLWVAGRHEPTIHMGAKEIAPHEGYPRAVDGGHLVVVDVSPAHDRLEIRTGPEASPGRWTLDLRREDSPTIARLHQEIPELGQDASREITTRAIAELRAAEPGMSTAERVASLSWRQKLHRQVGETQESLDAGREGMLLALEAGRFQFAARMGRILEYTLRSRGRDQESQWPREVQALYSPLSGDAEAMARSLFHSAQAAAKRGLLTQAIDDYEKSEQLSRRLGLLKTEAHALTGRLSGIAALHREEEVAAGVGRLLEIVDDPAMGTCTTRARLLGSAAWSLLTVPDAPTTQALSAVDRAIALLEDPTCLADEAVSEQKVYAGVVLNGALAALSAGELARARGYLDKMSDRPRRKTDARWETYARAVLDVREGRPVEGIARLASESGKGDPLLAWEAALLRAEAREALGEPKKAREEYRAAEAVLDGVVASAGTLRAVDGFLSNVQASAQGLIRHELALGDPRAAFAAARRARARPTVAFRRLRVAFSNPDARRKHGEAMEAYARDASALSAEVRAMESATSEARAASRRKQRELLEAMRRHLDAAAAASASEVPTPAAPRTPAPGELWVLAHPLGEARWAVFASLDAKLEAHVVELEADSTAALAGLFAGPLDGIVERAERVVFLPMGALASEPLHMIPWRGEALVVGKPVAYGLDLPAPTSERGAQKTASVVVGGSAAGGALEAAPREGQTVADELRKDGWGVTVVDGESLDRTAIWTSFDADLLHYAGHGESSGRDGLESALLLPDGDRITVRDILASPAAPAGVVLSACESAMPRADALDGGTSLATAFLLIGADWVIATSEPVPDRDAVRFSSELYRGGAPTDAPRAFRRALLAARADLEDWRRFRVLVR